MTNYLEYYKNLDDFFDFKDLAEPLSSPSILVLDQSHTCTGLAVYTESGLLYGIGYVSRESNQSKSEYRVHLKRTILCILKELNITTVIPEDMFGSTYGATTDLATLKNMFEDMKAEYGLDIVIEPKNNKWWKKRFLYPEKVSQLGSAAEKRQIKAEALRRYPALEAIRINGKVLPQDVYDVIGIGAAYLDVKLGKLPDSLTKEKSKVNKRLAVEVEVNSFPTPEDVRIVSTKLQSYCSKHGVEYVEYNTEETLEDNIRIASEEHDELLYFVIPEHPNIGSICLKNFCTYTPGNTVVAFGKLKSRK